MNPYIIPGIKKLDDLIDDVIADAFGVTVDEIKSPGRKRPGTEARQFAMWYRTRNTKESLGTIGRRYERDHSTVLSSCKAVNNLIETNKAFREKAEWALKVLDQYK